METSGCQRHLIIMTKYPQPGQTKTRLMTALGPQGAAALHSRLARHTIASLLTFNPEIRYSGGSPTLMENWLSDLNSGNFHAGNLTYSPQGNGDLGDRMARAFAASFAEGYDRVVMIGTDCPAIDSELVEQAFEQLQHQPITLGPAMDGGYYLIGLRSNSTDLFPAIFQGIAWSTETVLQQTLAIVHQSHHPITLLPKLPDIDRPDDLVFLPPSLQPPSNDFNYHSHLQ